MSINLELKLKKADKVYHEGENITGIIQICSNFPICSNGISLFVEGAVNLQLSSKNVGIFEAFYNSVKPIQLVNYAVEVTPSGKLPAGTTNIPFELPLQPKQNRVLYETYHGVFVNISYSLRCEMKRSFLAKDIFKSQQFLVQYMNSPKAVRTPVKFSISPESLQNARDRTNIPNFLVTGYLDSTVCCLTKPFTGELIVEKCEIPIKSVELQLVRVETCGCAEGYAKDALSRRFDYVEEASSGLPEYKELHIIIQYIDNSKLNVVCENTTEIQNIQIGEGDVPRDLAIPIYMIFPRLFTCPTLTTPNFKVEFEVNIVIVFNDDHLVTENFPIVLTRG